MHYIGLVVSQVVVKVHTNTLFLSTSYDTSDTVWQYRTNLIPLADKILPGETCHQICMCFTHVVVCQVKKINQ